jgi:hypothetical protein
MHVLLLALTFAAAPEDLKRYFAITIVDEQTGRGVPLVELRTVNNLLFVTDSNGIVAFHEPGLMDRDVFFHVRSHGYEFANDGFGFAGKMLHTTPGGNAKLSIKRINIAERLYRVTGAGIYVDSQLVGEKWPDQKWLLNAQVVGSDSVVTAVYRGKLHWFWGDTNRASYPLGNYQVPGATSFLPSKGPKGHDPEQGVELTYYVDKNGFAKQTMPMMGKGPTWMTTLIPLTDREGEGKERLYASFVKIEGSLTVYARGLAVWNDDKQEFVKLADVDMKAPIFPQGHAFIHDGHVYFAHPYPLTRVRATAEAFAKVEQYECYSCLKEGSRLDDAQIDRDADGKARYAWKKNTPAIGPAEQAKLIRAGKLNMNEALLRLRDRDTGKPVTAHAGSVYWNENRKRWIMIATEHSGTSLLGEVRYAEAESPTGPWNWTVKIVTHDKYSFYNPKQHPYFDKDGGRTIFFEGTYSHSFSGNPEQTPRYDYNQIMYKLDLSDSRLSLPAPIRNVENATGFAALDRSGPGSVPVVLEGGRLRVGEPNEKGIVFHALPKGKNEATIPLYEYQSASRYRYSTDPKATFDGFTRRSEPLCRVWPAAEMLIQVPTRLPASK